MTEPVQAAVEEEIILSVQDRCDRCGAQAKACVLTPSGELLLCGHHYRVNSATISELGYLVIGGE